MIDDIINRIISLLESSAIGITATSDLPEDVNIDDDNLPYAHVWSSGASRRLVNSSQYEISREFTVDLYYTLANLKKRRNLSVTMSNQDIVDELCHLFLENNKLQISDSGFNHIVTIDPPSDLGWGYTNRLSNIYEGTTITIRVKYQNTQPMRS